MAKPRNKPPSLAMKYVLSTVLRWQWSEWLRSLYNCSEPVNPKPMPRIIAFSVLSRMSSCKDIASIAAKMHKFPTADVYFPILTILKRSVIIATINPMMIDEKKSNSKCVDIIKPNAVLMSAIASATFHPRGRKKRSIDMILSPSSGARKGNFTDMTSTTEITTILATMP